jgi:hypothetical protein
MSSKQDKQQKKILACKLHLLSMSDMIIQRRKRMKRVVFLTPILLVSLAFVFSACTLHFPGMELDYTEYRVLLNVEPDDAQVLLNGKWIGEAYEFSNWSSALRLSSRNNELIVKKEGYVEEAIDLYEYNTRKIVIRLRLLRDKDYTAPIPPPDKRVKPAETEKEPGYQAKTLPPKKLPPEPPEETKLSANPVDVTLDIHPAEASIYLNGKFWGISPKTGKIENLRLEPGRYTLAVVKPGYRDYNKEIEVKEQKLSLNITLEKE